MPFDGPAGVLMEASDTVDRQAQQPNHANEPTVFFVNVREPLRRFDFFLCEIPAIRAVKRRHSLWSHYVVGQHSVLCEVKW